MDYRREIKIYGWQFIKELDEPDLYEPYVTSNDGYKHLYIYHKPSCDWRAHLKARTWSDLFETVRDAWNAHVFMKRGF